MTSRRRGAGGRDGRIRDADERIKEEEGGR